MIFVSRRHVIVAEREETYTLVLLREWYRYIYYIYIYIPGIIAVPPCPPLYNNVSYTKQKHAHP